jgi:hypothetical protein
MGMRFKGLISLLMITATSTVFTSASVAEEAGTATRISTEPVSEAFERVFFTNSGNFYRDQSLNRQIDFFLGKGSLLRNSFPENEIARDARRTRILYNDALRQQVSSDPLIRTPDLPTPYGTSLLVNPGLYLNRSTVNGSVPVSGELLFEPLPR